jgi:1-acyl-sn-glycerol-3-phosphate acyltransferase
MKVLSLLRSLLFYAAFYGGSVVSVTLATVAIAVAPRRLPGVVRDWSRWHRLCLRIAGIRVRESGARAIGPVLYAIRHESFFEAIDLPALLDQPAVFAKSELFAIPGWGRVARTYGVVPVARTEGAKTLRVMVAEARAFSKSGRPLVIFPEGTRTPHGEQAPLQAGFAGLYKLLGLPVVPVAVNSGPLYHRRIKRPGTITLLFGAPIEPGLPRAEIEARVMAAINALNPA